MHHVLAVSRNETLWAGTDVWLLDKVHAAYRDRAWHRLSTGTGSKGPDGTTGMPDPGGAGGCGLGALSVVSPFPDGPGRLAALRDLRPQGCNLEILVGTAVNRWHIESVFEAARQEVCLDHYEARSEVGWHRYVILVLWAPALLAGPQKGSGSAQPSRGLSLPEIRQLLWRLVLRVARGVCRVPAWSRWRRRQWVALCCYHRKQQLKLQQHSCSVRAKSEKNWQQ